MYLTRCPTCGEPDAVHPADLRRVVTCPWCQAQHAAAANEADNTREVFVGYVQAKIRPTGERLAFVGVVGVLFPVIALGLFVYQILVWTRDPDSFVDTTGVLVTTAVLLVMTLLSGVVFLGAVMMQRVRHYPLCVLAAILAMLPFANSCFPLGWIHGPMALYWLRKPEVRKAFALNRGEE